MHRTLAEETACPPAYDAWGQQRAFDSFRRMYNEERPHHALALRTPSEVYGLFTAGVSGASAGARVRQRHEGAART